MQEYESIYKATKEVATHNHRLASVRRKRSEEDDEDNIQRLVRFIHLFASHPDEPQSCTGKESEQSVYM